MALTLVKHRQLCARIDHFFGHKLRGLIHLSQWSHSTTWERQDSLVVFCSAAGLRASMTILRIDRATQVSRGSRLQSIDFGLLLSLPPAGLACREFFLPGSRWHSVLHCTSRLCTVNLAPASRVVVLDNSGDIDNLLLAEMALFPPFSQVDGLWHSIRHDHVQGFPMPHGSTALANDSKNTLTAQQIT